VLAVTAIDDVVGPPLEGAVLVCAVLFGVDVHAAASRQTASGTRKPAAADRRCRMPIKPGQPKKTSTSE
jgi:hypothetical protein